VDLLRLYFGVGGFGDYRGWGLSDVISKLLELSDGDYVRYDDVVKALQAMQGEATSQPAVPDGYVLMEINCVPDFVLEAAMRDYRLVKQLGGDDRTLVLTAITAALLSAAKGETE